MADRIIAIRLSEKEPGSFRVLLLEPVINSAELKIRRSGYHERQLHPGTRFTGTPEDLLALVQDAMATPAPKKTAPEEGAAAAAVAAPKVGRPVAAGPPAATRDKRPAA